MFAKTYNRESHSFIHALPSDRVFTENWTRCKDTHKKSWEDRRFIYIHLLLKSPSLLAVLRPAKLVSRPSVAAWEVQELQWSQGQARSRSGKVKNWPHLHVLGLVLGDVLLGAVVQDALHAEAAHLVNDGGDGAGVLQFESRLHGDCTNSAVAPLPRHELAVEGGLHQGREQSLAQHLLPDLHQLQSEHRVDAPEESDDD